MKTSMVTPGEDTAVPAGAHCFSQRWQSSSCSARSISRQAIASSPRFLHPAETSQSQAQRPETSNRLNGRSFQCLKMTDGNLDSARIAQDLQRDVLAISVKSEIDLRLTEFDVAQDEHIQEWR